MKLPRYILIALFCLSLSGCIELSDEHQTLGYNGKKILAKEKSICENKRGVFPFGLPAATADELDASNISLLSWNSYKGAKEGWLEMFSELSRDRDIIALQEGYLTDQLTSNLKDNSFTWDLAAAFEIDDISAGVLTASKVIPDGICSFWDEEPILTIPKTSMVTRYKLKGQTESLLVVNIHMVNFTMGTGSFKKQLLKTGKIIEDHQGPVILAGDFNTWSDKRMEILQELTASLQLQPVDFTEDNRTRFFGETVDHIYFRGLNVVQARVLPVEVSDHNPILATFSLQPLKHNQQG